MFVPEKYELARAVRLGKDAGVSEIYCKNVDIHEDERWVVFVANDGRATRVPRENIVCVIGTWVTLDSKKTPDELTIDAPRKQGRPVKK